jgi:H+-translocating NAD(P) transhydrogenase subunit alpha
MTLVLAVPKEISAGESRVAMVPSVVDKLLKQKVTLKVQQAAGSGCYIDDAAYKGADVVAHAKELYASADIILKVQPPTVEEIRHFKSGAILVSLLYPHLHADIVAELQAKKITSFALELIPRTSRAQIMDVLSTQATVVGYKAVLLAANSSKIFFPMLATGAGTLRPANVLIIGAGVAGLQAIATAKRLGARVEAYDVRPATKQEVESLGAKFVDVGIEAVGAGGYARELTAEEKAKQQEMLAKRIAASDIVITTAGVPGKKAPIIISKAVVETMRPGAVIVDAMAEMGGNCELTKPGADVIHRGVTIIGVKDLASSLAINASEMFARNVFNFITPMLKDGALNIDWQDEIILGSLVTKDGEIQEKKS